MFLKIYKRKLKDGVRRYNIQVVGAPKTERENG
jgi:hypothetical protein